MTACFAEMGAANAAPPSVVFTGCPRKAAALRGAKDKQAAALTMRT